MLIPFTDDADQDGTNQLLLNPSAVTSTLKSISPWHNSYHYYESPLYMPTSNHLYNKNTVSPLTTMSTKLATIVHEQPSCLPIMTPGNVTPET